MSKRLIASALALLLAGSLSAHSQEFPSRPIILVVPFSAGGNAETQARAFANAIGDSLGQPVLVESRPGGGGAIAGHYVASAKPDGHTLLLVSDAPNATLQHVNDRLPYDPIESFQPITKLWENPVILATRTNLGTSTVAELVELGSAGETDLRYVTFGPGSTGELGGRVLRDATGMKMRPVPYPGGSQAWLDILGERVDVYFGSIAAAQAYVDSGDVKILAQFAPERWDRLADVPTFSESGMGEFNLSIWFGIAAPAGTPDETIQKLYAAFVEASKDESIQTKFPELGLIVSTNESPEEFKNFMKEQEAIIGNILNGSAAKQP